jgi:hypothetical protein
VSDAIIQQLVQDIGRELSAMPKGDPDACERYLITHPPDILTKSNKRELYGPWSVSPAYDREI